MAHNNKTFHQDRACILSAAPERSHGSRSVNSQRDRQASKVSPHASAPGIAPRPPASVEKKSFAWKRHRGPRKALLIPRDHLGRWAPGDLAGWAAPGAFRKDSVSHHRPQRLPPPVCDACRRRRRPARRADLLKEGRSTIALLPSKSCGTALWDAHTFLRLDPQEPPQKRHRRQIHPLARATTFLLRISPQRENADSTQAANKRTEDRKKLTNE